MSTSDISSKKIDRFTRLLYGLITVLAVACFVLLYLTLQQGPRLRRAQVSTSNVTQQPNEHLTLYASQPLAGIASGQVTIEPKAAFTTVSSGETITIQFTERLAYDTTYRVHIRDVRDSYQSDKTSDFSYTFTTSDPTLYYLKRNKGTLSSEAAFAYTKKPDQIMQTTLSGNKNKEVFSATRIQEFTQNKDKIFAVTLDTQDTNSLYIIDKKTGHSVKQPLSVTGKITDLQTSANNRLVGFRFTGNDTRQKDLLYDLDLTSDPQASPVRGLNRKPLQVVKWQFAPDGTTILAQLSDRNLLLVDGTKQYDPVPLGQFSDITNFSYDGSKIAAESKDGPLLIDAVTHTRKPIKLQNIDSKTLYSIKIKLLSNSEGFLARAALLRDDASYQYHFLIHKNGADKTFYVAKTDSNDIDDFSLSPNDQYMTLEVAPHSAVYDTYPSHAKPDSVHTQIIDTTNGKLIKSIDGINIVWDQR